MSERCKLCGHRWDADEMGPGGVYCRFCDEAIDCVMESRSLDEFVDRAERRGPVTMQSSWSTYVRALWWEIERLRQGADE